MRPYLATHKKRMWLLKTNLIIIPFAIVGYVLVYFLVLNKPEAFKSAIESIENNKEILNKIGDYDSYTYNEKDLPDENSNPYTFKIEINGSLATIILTCKVSKDKMGKWHLLEAKQDSLIKVKKN